MKKMSAVVFLLVVAFARAENTGVIRGTVKDAANGAPLYGANIILESTTFGTVADSAGRFEMTKVPIGVYSMRIQMIGFEKWRMENLRVIKDSVTVVNASLKIEILRGETVTIAAQKATIKMDMTGSVQSFSVSAPSFAQLQAPPPSHNTEEYGKIDETGFRDAIKYPISTFAADVDAASYSNVRRFIIENQFPPKDAVRAEECVNYFDYDYPQPKNGRPLSITLEYGECPWNMKHNLVHIGLQGKKLDRKDEKPSNLVFLLDVSGSMEDENKLPLLKRAFKMLVDQLKPEDRIAIVIYASTTMLYMPSTSGSDKAKLKNAIDSLEAGGSTAGGEGLQLAYKTVRENFIPNGNNRVILATDGDFNVGVSSTSELVRFIEEKRREGVFLTILGFGMGNYKDERLQQIADRGNGNHYYIDNILEAKKVLVQDLTSTLFTIAKDVKIQVEFNPAKIRCYRLIGYENRMLNEEDFKDDRKDAGEIGAGHKVTALYEVVPAERSDRKSDTLNLKYQTTVVKDSALKSSEVMTVRIRYKDPEGDRSTEFSEVLKGSPFLLAQTSENFRFAAAVAEFAMVLRDSEFKGDSNLAQVKSMAKGSVGQDPNGYRAELLNLVERADTLIKNP